MPPCDVAPDQDQTAYRIVVVNTVGGATVWDSGQVLGNASTYVIYSGPALSPASRYSWTVSTWTQSCGASPPSLPAAFVTAPWGGWNNASFITTASSGIFGYFRKVISVPADVASAVGFIAASNDDRLLSGYKLYVDNGLVNIGPARGEAPVWGGDGVFRALPITTLDLTAVLTPGQHVLALEVGPLSHGAQRAIPWRHPPAPTLAPSSSQAMHTGGPSVIFEVDLTTAAGATTPVVTDATWLAFDADVHRRPGPATDGGSAGTKFLEYIDARAEPVGWRASGFVPGAGWAAAVATQPSASDLANLHPRMQPSLVVINVTAVSVTPVPTPPNPSKPVQCGIVPENSNIYLGCECRAFTQGVWGGGL